MANLRSLPLCVLSGVLLVSTASVAQQAATASRIVNPVDETQLVKLGGTVHPLANARNDRGAAPDSMQLDRLHLVLKRSPSQEAALHELIGQMHTPGSASYHKWLTPDQFGAQFGPSDQDIATVETWLTGHGFNVAKVNPGKQTIEFSGNVAQLRTAFHTQIHKYEVNGETHYANANDPQIPAALAPVVGGFASLNNFRAKNNARVLGKASYDAKTGLATPQWTTGPGSPAEDDSFVLSPADYAVQYDLNPLYSANIKGDGETIAVVNDSNVNIDLVNQFRTLFGLPANPPQVIIDGNDPGVDGINDPDGPNYDSIEAYLDVEWAGATAPDATVDLVVGADTALENGLELAAERAVYSNVAPIISLSFGACEADLGIYNQYFSSLWEEAAAQGITVLVSTGDDGASGCDSDGNEFAVDGQEVSGFASTPYNVAVGGTDFYYSDFAGTQAAVDSQLATYWTTTPSNSTPAVSILSVIPEQPWNDSQYGDNIFSAYTNSGDTATTIAGGSGGASNAAVCSNNTFSSTTGLCTGTVSGYAKPAWQSAASSIGVPGDGVRDIPDLSLFAAVGYNDSYYPECYQDGDCQTGGGSVQITGVGGTSASTPAMAGIMALVNQKYGRQGQADFVLYPLRAQYPAAFHDVTHGSNSMPCEYSPTPSPDCISVASPISVTVSENGGSATVEEGQIGTGTTPEYNAVAGYNLATGLGTVDANVLVNDWNKVTFKSTSMTLTPSSTSFAHGTAVTVSGSVTTASGTPTGSVALMTDSTEPGEQGVGLTSVISNGSATGAQSTFALSGGSFSGSVSTLPGGTYDIWGSYGGDGTFGMTSSTPVQITVTPEASTLNLNIVAPESANGYFTAGSAPGNQVDYGTQMNLRALVAPSSKASQEQTCITTGGACPVYTAPTGVVKFVDGSTTINTAAINAEGDAEYNAPFAVGTHSITATYAGDNSYQASPAVTAIPFTVVKDTPTIELGVSAQDGNGDTLDGPNQPLVFSVVVLNGIQSDYGSSSGSYTSPVAAPTGTVTQTGFPTGVPTSSTLSAEVDPAFLGGTQAVAGVANFIVPAGTTVNSTYNVTFCYSGDSNYTALTGSNCSGYQIPIVNTNGSGVTSTTTATISTSTVSPNAGILVSGTVTGVSGHAAPTGLIYVYADGYYVNSAGFYSSSGITSSFSFQLNSQNLIQGANQITLQYTGDSVYNPSAFTLNSGNPISSPLSDFTLIPDTTIVPVSISSGAGNGTDSINVTSVNGFTGTVDLTCTATSPLTCTISPNPALTNQSSAASTLTINVPSGTANGNYNVLVTGKDAATSEFVHTLAITADVSGATPGFTLSNSGDISVAQGTGAGGTSTISATPSDGFTGTVNLSCAVTGPMGATSPVTCSIAPSVDITGSGAVTATLTATSTATTTAGNYTITVTGISGSITETTTVNVAVTVPGFTLINSGNISMAQGASGTSMITAMPSGGFTGTVNLSCAVTGPTGATSPVTCTVTPSVNITGASPQTATLTAASTATTTTGTYTITVTGTSGNLTEPPTPVTVTVTSAVAPSFALSNSGSISVSPGATSGNTSTISVTPSGGFTGTVNLTCAVTGPTGANDPPTCGFASSSVTISGTTAQMDVMTLSTTAASSSMNKPLKLFWPSTGGTVLAVVFFFVLPKRRRNWLVMILLLVGFVSGAAIGCGGGGGTTTTTIPGTTAGTYTVTVTGTSGNITMTTPVTLTVN